MAGQRRHARAPQVARTAHEAPRTPPPRRRAAAPPHPRWGLRTHEPTQQQRTSGENDVKIAESFIYFVNFFIYAFGAFPTSLIVAIFAQ